MFIFLHVATAYKECMQLVTEPCFVIEASFSSFRRRMYRHYLQGETVNVRMLFSRL